MTTSQRQTPGPDFDMAESKTLQRRPSRLPGGERSDRAGAIRVRGNGRTIGSAAPSPGICGPTGRGAEELAEPYRKMTWRGTASERRVMSDRKQSWVVCATFG